MAEHRNVLFGTTGAGKSKWRSPFRVAEHRNIGVYVLVSIEFECRRPADYSVTSSTTTL
ncbi:hypothetical protein [Nonomuraea sp. NEAU-A123]|uniref:hypothetical protein n=1 Tax=Nonomuraea sp. NEAU-A123 TaxID=2839649 RepID=UPI001BE426C6|nr:hypothetical protein [Nonomuraea sp. NEAU-A123]MBT2234239.1 hypothetical protein [Nonomuraea sp. NEAU-A123]